MARVVLPPLDRFMSKVVVEASTRFPQYVSSPCWWWVGARSRGGKHPSRDYTSRLPYGYFTIDGKCVRAHRWLYQHLQRVTLSPRQHLDHICRNTLCVNPAHMRVVSGAWNVARANRDRHERSEP